MSTLKHWIWLTTREKVDQETIEQLLEQFGSPEAVYEADGEAYEMLRLSDEKQQALKDKSMARANQILDQCDRLGIWVMTRQDADYPVRLRNIYGAPCVLYGKGRRIHFDEEPAVAVVGTRKCSRYGKKVASQLGFQLARQGMLVISGLARGIDTEATAGALRAGMPTVGVLGGGIDVIYPPENERIYEEVAARGLLLSEYPPGTRPLGVHFPVRNRIMSGLSLGTLVVEGPLKSGALITARHAVEQGRDVFAIPGNIDQPLSTGPNRLLREGAIPVLGADDVVAEYLHLYPRKLRFSREPVKIAAPNPTPKQADFHGSSSSPAKKEVDKPKWNDYIDLNDVLEPYSEKEKAVLRALEPEPMQVDHLAERTQIQPGELLSILTVLELRGVAVQTPGKCFYRCGALQE